MRSKNIVLPLFLLLFSALPALHASEPALQRIVFGSCADQTEKQDFWKPIRAAKPQLVLLLGDNVYGDIHDTMTIEKAYGILDGEPVFKALRAETEVMATWDDHDYGPNDAGFENPIKDDAQRLFLDFLRVPKESPRRAQKGIYNARTFGPPGRRVQVILLDTRYFRSLLRKNAEGAYIPDDRPDRTILGDEQWAWLAERLQEPADLRFIGSSIQVAAEEQVFEKWANFPLERQRLLAEIRKVNGGGVVILSGDRHHAELSVLRGGVGCDLYDLTASSFNKPRRRMLTKAGRAAPPEPNRLREGDIVYDANFGMVQIDWDAPTPAIRLEIRDMAGKAVLSRVVSIKALSPAQ